jgi:hypothetical protein
MKISDPASQAWWCMPVKPAFQRGKQKDLESEISKFQASLGYIVRP